MNSGRTKSRRPRAPLEVPQVLGTDSMVHGVLRSWYRTGLGRMFSRGYYTEVVRVDAHPSATR
eukprot:3956265-Prymnesium_polylepis.1